MFGKSTKYLPENYQHYKTFDLNDFRSIFLVNLLAIGFLVAGIFLFDLLIKLLRPEIIFEQGKIDLISAMNIIQLLGISIIVIIIHELIHGIFFWVYTNDSPIFAFKFLYAYAGAPEWYIPKANFVVIGLSPAILITLLVILLIRIVPFSWIMFISVAGMINFAGSTGDYVVIVWILAHPNICLVKDSGDSFDVYDHPDQLI